MTAERSLEPSDWAMVRGSGRGWATVQRRDGGFSVEGLQESCHCVCRTKISLTDRLDDEATERRTLENRRKTVG